MLKKKCCQNGQKTTKSCFKSFRGSKSQVSGDEQLIDDTMEEECQKEKIFANEVIFLQSLKSKS